MTTPTDTEKMAQVLRELFETWLESRPSFRTTVEVQAAWEGWKANTAVAAMLAAHESRAQPASVADGWQPIETAPRTGRTLILLLTPSGWPQVAYSNTWWTTGFSVECKPTKWAPIPQPPASENVCDACEGAGYLNEETPTMFIEYPCPNCNGGDANDR